MANTVNQIDPWKVDEWRGRLAFWLRNDAAKLLWPARCLACDEPGLDAVDLCAACLEALPWNGCACPLCALPLPAPAIACGACLQRRRPAPLDAVHAACLYAAPLDRLLPRLKFQQDLPAGRLLAQLMAQALATAPRPQALVPVPLHRERLRRRGYDQTLELARPLGRALGVPVLAGALVRARPTQAQSTLDARQRARNLRGAFAVPGGPVPAHVALVDDVMTTGATLAAAATALKRAGVARVDAWVCARVP